MSAGKILIADRVSAVCRELLEKGGFEVEVLVGAPRPDFQRSLAGAVGLVVRSDTKVTEQVLAAAPRLKVVGRAGTGVDNIDVPAATRRGVVVMNAPGENTIAAAEHTVTLMLALARRIPGADHSIKAGKWERSRFLGVELYGKRLGVVGLGKVGREVATRARAFGMEVLGHDPFLPDEVMGRLGCQVGALDDLLTQADFLTFHIPLNTQTRHLIGRAELARCKPGVRIINCARGGIIDEKALAEAIHRGRVAGAALDVFEQEPPAPGNPLLELEEVVMTPHLGASTLEAQKKVAVRIAEQMVAYLKRGSVTGAVNVDSIAPEILKSMGPWLDLAERIGRLHSRMAPAAAEEVTVELSGSILEHPVQPVMAAFLKGYLEDIVTEPVNLVNAPVLAKEVGLRVSEVRAPESTDYTSLVTATLKGGGKQRTLAGTLFGKSDPRIVRFDDYRLDAMPVGEMLICTNDDRPGMLGTLGTILGEAGVNIAYMSLGRDRSGGKALAIFNLDNTVDHEVLAYIRSRQGILWAERVSL